MLFLYNVQGLKFYDECMSRNNSPYTRTKIVFGYVLLEQFVLFRLFPCQYFVKMKCFPERKYAVV